MVARRFDIPKEQIREFCARHGVAELSLFGSALREDFGAASDVDVLIALEPRADDVDREVPGHAQ